MRCVWLKRSHRRETRTRWAGRRPLLARQLHTARGWRQRACRKCRAYPGDPCQTPSGRLQAEPHKIRLSPGRGEFTASTVWEELEKWGAATAVVSFSGGGGSIGEIGTIRLKDEEELQITRWSFYRTELGRREPWRGAAAIAAMRRVRPSRGLAACEEGAPRSGEAMLAVASEIATKITATQVPDGFAPAEFPWKMNAWANINRAGNTGSASGG